MGKGCRVLRKLELLSTAETRRFELLKALTPYLVSSEDRRDVLSLIYAYLTSLQCN